MLWVMSIAGYDTWKLATPPEYSEPVHAGDEPEYPACIACGDPCAEGHHYCKPCKEDYAQELRDEAFDDAQEGR